MIVQFFPKVAGVVIVTPWSRSNGQVNCVARLTRSLTTAEAERLEEILDIQVEGDRLRYRCRPEELEGEEERIVDALLRISRPPAERARRRRGKTTQPPQ
jgi:hypothetical protein